MVKIICDICKEEIPTTSIQGGIFTFYKMEQPVDFKTGTMGNPVAENVKYDCCGKCVEEILEFVKKIKK